MRILHLSDFHFQDGSKHSYDQDQIVDKLISSLEAQKDKIDFLFFTGDLVNDGSELQVFLNAHDLLIKKVATGINLDINNSFLCPGNHAVHRNQEMPAISSQFEKIKSSDQLDKFIENPSDKQFLESLTNIQNYIEFQKNINTHSEDIVEPLYTVHKRAYDGKVVGIATINSAWRSYDSENDRGNLFYPISFIKSIITHLAECDFKVLLMHHSIPDFKDFIVFDIEDLIFQNFHFLLSGHYHKQKTSLHFTSGDGIFCSIASAALTKTEHHGSIGYTIFDVDIETYDVEITCVFYNSITKSFDITETQSATIPTQKVKQEQNKLRKTFRKKYDQEFENANKLFVSNNEISNDDGFIELFTEPILKTKSKSELASNKGKEEPSIPLIEIINSQDSYIIFGKDKSGRTSLLYRIKLELLKKFSTYNQIPLYIDFNSVKKDSAYSIFTNLRNYYEISRDKMSKLANNFTTCLLIDNYDPAAENLYQTLIQFLKEFPTTKLVICSEITIQRSYSSMVLDGIKCKKLFIHEITRKEIRTLTNKWSGISGNRKEVVIEKIVQIFTQLNIPTNYWTVSLFLWIFEKTSDANFHNNFELIQLYIDGLIERKKLAVDKYSKINYDDLKSFLGNLAHFLLTNHNEFNYSASYAEIVEFTENYRKERKRFIIQVEDIIVVLLERGILKRDIDNRYAFRLNGVFEYFIAYYMTESESFRKSRIEDNHFYLSFGNEFELYSGFNKKDKEFVNSIYDKTQNIFKVLNEKYVSSSTDLYLTEKINEAFDISSPIKQLAESKESILSPEDKDSLLEQADQEIIKEEDVKLKSYYEEIELTHDNLEKSLLILSRVYRNSTFVDTNLEEDILDFILNSACNLGFLLIDEAEEETAFIDLGDHPNEKILIQLVTNFMPIVVQVFLFDALMQQNLERIIKEKINQLSKDSKKNQFKLFILYFLLIDFDVKNNKIYIDELIEKARIGTLKQSVLLKLYLYLMLKSYGDSDLETYLKSKIREQSKNIDPKADLNVVDKKITQNKRIAALKRSSDRRKKK